MSSLDAACDVQEWTNIHPPAGGRILLIEDDFIFALAVASSLQAYGLVVDHAPKAEQAARMAGGNHYDLMIVDRGLPDGDGLGVLQRLRSEGNTTPAVILSSLTSTRERVDGLIGGADAYLNKPCDFTEIAAQARVLLRRAAATPRVMTTLQVEDLKFDLLARTASRGGVALRLHRREYQVLHELAKHAGFIVTREIFYANVFGYDFDPGTGVLEVYIARLRKKVDRGFDRPLIKTVRKAGYMISGGTTEDTVRALN